MTTDLPTAAVDVAQTIFTATRFRPFDRAVHEFTRVLQTVPDCAFFDFSSGTLQVLQHLANRVVEQIERRLATGVDGMSHRQDLAQAVFDIRQAIEDIDIWRHLAHS